MVPTFSDHQRDNIHRYVLVTPARDEELHIEKTILSVIAQTILPHKWVIVSDGSVDSTCDIVKRYQTEHDFIVLVQVDSQPTRNFASKAFAVRAGNEVLSKVDYDFIGNLDADVSFAPDYYEKVLAAFQQNVDLGIAGGTILEDCSGSWIPQFTQPEWSVSGPIQMFRRQCFVDIGGYFPARRGGVDAIAEVMARMHGWRVQAFPFLTVYHHRRTGTEKGNILFARFRQGRMEYCNGYHPLFEFARCIARATEPPFVLGSLFRLSGFICSFLCREPHALRDDVVSYVRKEQLGRLFNTLGLRRLNSTNGR